MHQHTLHFWNLKQMLLKVKYKFQVVKKHLASVCLFRHEPSFHCADTSPTLTSGLVPASIVNRNIPAGFFFFSFFYSAVRSMRNQSESIWAGTCSHCGRCGKCPGPSSFSKTNSHSPQQNTGGSARSASQLCCLSPYQLPTVVQQSADGEEKSNWYLTYYQACLIFLQPKFNAKVFFLFFFYCWYYYFFLVQIWINPNFIVLYILPISICWGDGFAERRS